MPWKNILIPLALLAAVALGLGFFWPFGRRAPLLHLPGVVEIQEVRLGSKVGGRVEKVDAIEGTHVEAGQPLVYFEVPELKAQRQQIEARLGQAEADLDKAKNGPRPEEIEAAREALEAARARWERLKVGARPEEIEQAREELEVAKADLNWSRQKLERIKRQGVPSTTPEEIDAASAAVNRSQAQTNAAQAKLKLLLAGSRPEEIEEARAEMKRAGANYELLKAGTRAEDIQAALARVNEARGKLQELDASLEEAVVKAPERVLVEVVAVRKGDLVAPNQPILRVLRADDLWIKVYVPETEMGKLRLNQEVEVTVDAYPNRRFTGSVMLIASESEFTPRNVQSADERRHQVFGVKIRVADPQGVFKSGMAAEVIVSLQ